MTDRPEALRLGAALLARHRHNQPSGEDQLRFTLACELRDLGISPEGMLDLMVFWNDNLADHPRDHALLEKAVNNAEEYARDEAGNEEPGLPAAQAFAQFFKPAPPPPSSPAEAATRAALEKGARLTFSSWAEAKNAPPAAWLIKGAVLDQGLTALYSPPKRGKSLAALDLALAVATGRPWLGAVNAERHGPVVYIAQEGFDETVERARAWETHHKADLSNFFLVRGRVNAMEAGEAEALAAGILACTTEPALVVLDTWARSMAGQDENAAGPTGQAAANLEAVCEAAGAPMLILHHSNAQGGMRGSGALLAAVGSSLSVDMQGGHLLVKAVETRRGAPDLEIRADIVNQGEFPVLSVAAPIEGALPATPAMQALLRHRALLGAMVRAATTGTDGDVYTVTKADYIRTVEAFLPASVRLSGEALRKAVERALDGDAALKKELAAERGRIAIRQKADRPVLMQLIGLGAA